jgi:hypothetical protein
VIGRRDFVVCVVAGGVSLFLQQGRLAPTAPQSRVQAPGPTQQPGAPSRPVRLVWKHQPRDRTPWLVEVSGIDPIVLAAVAKPGMTRDLWSSVLPVRVVPPPAAAGTDPPPLWGSYRVHGELIQFAPRFPLLPGTRYRAELDLAKLHGVARDLADANQHASALEPETGVRLTAEFTPPRKPAGPAATVVAVYPTADLLPENLLRFYIDFSAPMSRGEAYGRIRLLDAHGKPVEAAFLELDEELWSSDGTRFTLVFDPGRVKKGLKPREELGPILVAGQSYSLVIDRDWKDAEGNPLAREFRKQFRTGPADETSPDPKAWKIVAPRPDGREPLKLHFPEPLDRRLLDRLIGVEDSQGRHVPGQVAVASAETLWSYTPQHPWRSGDYRLVVGTVIEDVAGNSVAGPFEVDQTRPISKQITTETVTLPFRIGTATR